MVDTKITDLPALSAPAGADLIEVVDDVAGTPTNKKVLLSDLLAAINADSTIAGLFAGTAFPGSPTDRQVFFRTDRGIHYYYDLANTRWLSVQEFVTSFPSNDEAIDGSVSAAAMNTGRMSVPYRGTYSILVTRFQVSTVVLTTNTGASYWTIKLNRADVDDADTQVGTTMNTSAHTVAKVNDQFVSPNVVLDASARWLKLRVDKVGTPGALYCTGLLGYRLVG